MTANKAIHVPTEGNVYGAHPDVIVGGDAHAGHRRVVAVREIKSVVSLWECLGRSTTDIRPGDLHSPIEPSCNLDKVGIWSIRFKHSVSTEQLGNKVRCPFYGLLPEPARTQVLNYYEESRWG